MEPGIYRGLANDVYHHGPGISKSGLDLIRKSPAHYRAVVTAANDNERAPTAAQFLGTALHMIVLEPELFAQTYTLAVSRADVPDAVDDRDVLVAMISELNLSRLPKLGTSGSKEELSARLLIANEEHRARELPMCDPWDDATAKGADLKNRIVILNAYRTGLLPVSGSRHDLAEILRANGKPVTLWSDVQAEWTKNNGHRTILSAEQFEQLRNMRDAVMAHPAASKLLAGEGEAELSAYWMQRVTDPVTGEVVGEQLCRVRPDYWRKDGILIDLKSTEDASEEEFARSIAKWGYEVQDDFYLHGTGQALLQGGDFEGFAKPRAFVFIAVEKSARVVDGHAKGVAVYRLDDESRTLGRMKWQADLLKYTQCQASGEWPGYSIKIRQIKLPAWQFTKAAAAAAATE